MTNLKISALSAGIAPDANADVVPIVQGGVTKKAPVGQLGGIIAWARVIVTTPNYTTTSTPFVDVDAANLKVTFSAPPSGKVVVTACFSSMCSSGSPYVNLRDSVGDVANTPRNMVSSSGWQNSGSVSWPLTGLTPGTSYTYKLGFRGSGATTTIFVANVLMPTMVVWAVPG